MLDLLSIQPAELKFPFELKKQISCQLRLVNVTDQPVAFKVKTTSPKKYCVRPNTGVVLPRSSSEITVTMQAQKEAPDGLVCKDKFLVQSVVVPEGVQTKDVTPELFNKEVGKDIVEAKLRVSYVPPPSPPSPVAEGSDEGVSPPRTPFKNSETDAYPDSTSKDVVEMRAKLAEARMGVASMTNERNDAVNRCRKAEEELAKLQNEIEARVAARVATAGSVGPKSRGLPPSSGGGGFSWLILLIIAIIAFLVGFFIN